MDWRLTSTSFSWAGLARAYSEDTRKSPRPQKACVECDRLRYALVTAISTYVIAGRACDSEPAENDEFEKWKAKRKAADDAWDEVRRDLIRHEKTHCPV
jgi:hypothetical protein